MEQQERERRALAAGLKADRRKLERVERELARHRAEGARLAAERVRVLAGQSSTDLDLLTAAESVVAEAIAQHEAAAELARRQVELAEGALRRLDDWRRADELERLAGQLVTDRHRIDEAMELLAERFRAQRETMLAIARVDREAGRDVAYPHRYALPARLAAIKAGLPSFVPTDHVANSKGGRRLAEMEEPALHRRIRELRGEGEHEQAA